MSSGGVRPLSKSKKLSAPTARISQGSQAKEKMISSAALAHVSMDFIVRVKEILHVFLCIKLFFYVEAAFSITKLILDGSDALQEGVWTFAGSSESVYLTSGFVNTLADDCIRKTPLDFNLEPASCNQVSSTTHSPLCEFEIGKQSS